MQGALVSVIIIWITTGVLVYLAAHRVMHSEYHINAEEMVITAALGLAFNLVYVLTSSTHEYTYSRV